MSAKYTSGPLRLGKRCPFDIQAWADDPESNRICRIASVVATPYRGDGEANAERLIACWNACVGIYPEAVPDLLAALEDMLNPNALDDAGHKARAAIAKAKGEDPT